MGIARVAPHIALVLAEVVVDTVAHPAHNHFVPVFDIPDHMADMMGYMARLPMQKLVADNTDLIHPADTAAVVVDNIG